MHDFRKDFGAETTFVGTVVTHGPYGVRLSVSAEIEPEDLEHISWPDDDWISEACGEKVRHWTSGEGDCEEVYLPESADAGAAENARIMYGA